VSRYSPETVRERAFAFDGTVKSVETRVDPKLPAELARLGSQSQELPWVTFKVNRWFKGGGSPEVSIWVPRHAPEGVWPLEPGDRLLAAGEYRWGQPPEDPLAWGCGFTQLHTPEAAAQWANAMPAPTATASTQMSTPVPEPTLAVFPKPPLADLTIGEQHQTAGLGSYCWRGPNETNDGGMRAACADMIGLPTAHEPLQVDSPFSAKFRFGVERSPSELHLGIFPVEAEDQIETRDRGNRWWRPNRALEEQAVLPLAQETSTDISLEPGLYVFEIFGKWPDSGTVSYGFLVEVR